DTNVPADVKKTSLVENFSYSLNARKIIARLNVGYDNRDQPEAKTSSYWSQRAADLQLLGLRVQVANIHVGTTLLMQGKALWKVLQERKLVDANEEKLLALAITHSLGDWDATLKDSAQVAIPVSDWFQSDAIWWSSWLQGVKKSLPTSFSSKGLPAEMELVDKIRQAYISDDPQMATWLLQTASVEPDSPYLWYASAQINWRKSQNVQVQNAYRDFIIGLGALSLYPPAIQIAYWTQFADFLRSYARAETYRRALDNIDLLRGGDISVKGKTQKQWWDIGDDGLNAKDIADEILARSSSGMLNARDQAALEVLGSSLDKGSQYLFVVGTHLAFEGEWTSALAVFDGILQRDPKNTDALFGKIWALGRLFRFSEAQDTYTSLVRASLGSITHLRSKALIHFMGREYLEAHRILNDYLKQAPTDAWAHYFEAEVFLAQENYLECIKSANLAKLTGKGELQFRSEQTFFRCRVKGGVGIRDSLDSIAKEIKLSPDSLPLRILYIDLMQESHLYEDAIRVLDDSLKYFPFSSKLKLAAGNLYDSQGMPGKSLDYYSQAEKLDPTLAEPWVRIGQALLKQDKFVEAAKNFEIAARVQPTYPEIYLFAARAYESAGMIDETASSYAKEIQERPSAVGTFVEAAEFLLKNNAPQKIPELYRRFQTGGFEEDPRALVRLAQAYNVMNDLENAKAYASRAVAGNPDNPYANLILANILDRAADYNLAKRYYESYLRLMPLAEDRDSLKDRLSKPPYSN
ncbi:MAG: tetratricopeptide repeat protein, partial [Bdellovibrionota bacterium]